MADPVMVTIGGEQIELPPVLNFAQLERIWPAMKALDATQDLIERTAARIAIVSGALKETRPDLSVAEIKKRLRVEDFREISGLILPVHELLIASGLMPKDQEPGEALAPGTAPAESPT